MLYHDILIAIGLLVILQAIDICDGARLVLGIKNEGNTCYINSIVQNLFYFPDIRQQVLEKNIFSTNEPAFSLACVFARLQSPSDFNDEKEMARLSPDFLPAYEKHVKTNVINLSEVGHADDTEAFFTWAVNSVLPLGLVQSFKITTEITNHFKDLCYKTTLDNDIAFRVMFPEGVKVIDLEEAINAEYVEMRQGIRIAPTEVKNIDEALEKAQVSWLDPADVTFISKVVSTGPMLAIHVKKNFDQWKRRKGHRRPVVKYKKIMNVNGIDYHLQGLVIYENNHYWTITRTDIQFDTWHQLNDSTANQLASSDQVVNFGKKVVMLFYLCEDAQTVLAKKENLYSPTIPVLIKEHLENSYKQQIKSQPNTLIFENNDNNQTKSQPNTMISNNNDNQIIKKTIVRYESERARPNNIFDSPPLSSEPKEQLPEYQLKEQSKSLGKTSLRGKKTTSPHSPKGKDEIFVQKSLLDYYRSVIYDDIPPSPPMGQKKRRDTTDRRKKKKRSSKRSKSRRHSSRKEKKEDSP